MAIHDCPIIAQHSGTMVCSVQLVGKPSHLALLKMKAVTSIDKSAHLQIHHNLGPSQFVTDQSHFLHFVSKKGGFN